MSDVQPPPPMPGDHRAAKADAKAAKAREKAMRPWFKKKRFILPIILFVLVVAIVASSGGSDDSTTDVASDAGSQAAEDTGSQSQAVDAEGSEADDVAVESCDVGEFNYIEMKLKVTNNSSKRSTYFIDTVVEGPDGSQIDSGFASVDNLEPGQSTITDVALITEAPGEFSCRIVEVDRMSDE